MAAGLHEQTDTTDLQDQELAAYNEALKRRGSLTIWFDPGMSRDGIVRLPVAGCEATAG